MCDLLNEEIVCILNSLFPEQLQHNAISNIIIEANPENTAEEADEEGNGEKPIWNSSEAERDTENDSEDDVSAL